MAPPRVARILIVDDSAVMRSLLRSVILSDKRLEVAGTAIDGASALRAMDNLCPDLILLDVEMPVMDGLSTLKQMKAKGRRVPVIMCSSLTQRGAKVTIEALACGAADYVAKPTGQASREAAIQTLAQDLVPKILALTAIQSTPVESGSGAHGAFPLGPVPVHAVSGVYAHASGGPLPHGSVLPAFVPPQPARHAQQPIPSTPPAVVCIGISTGGPAALDVLIPALPANFPVPILIVQHMPELFTKLLAERLDSRCPIHVTEATNGEAICPGTVYIAKGNWHMEVIAGDRHQQRSSSSAPPAPLLRLTQEPQENHCRPAVDVLFRTAVSVFGSRVLGVVMTGMGSDGLIGSRIIRDHNGTVLAQDQATSAVWGMPGSVAQAGLAHRILPLNAIVPELLRLAGRGQREAFELRESAV